MTKYYPRSHYDEQQQEQRKDRGWYCKEHDARHPCDICGYENIHKQKEPKYYFVSG